MLLLLLGIETAAERGAEGAEDGPAPAAAAAGATLGRERDLDLMGKIGVEMGWMMRERVGGRWSGSGRGRGVVGDAGCRGLA
jgi:hypothetical protein